jgi:pyruvate kinase
LERLKRGDMGLVLKIETLQGFENLPELMLAAMASDSSGIMIARGDLAVECGFERMAEVQEEILCCAEAAHIPVIWATQVLESMAKTGMPSRAEISDAGLGVRAECVMLNKGPFIVDAIRTLDDILQRMAGHQNKKRPLLRALRAWSGGGTAAPSDRGEQIAVTKKSSSLSTRQRPTHKTPD